MGNALFAMGQSRLKERLMQCKGWAVSDVVDAFFIALWMTPEVTFSLTLSSHVCQWFFYPQHLHLCLSPAVFSAQAQDELEMPMS